MGDKDKLFLIVIRDIILTIVGIIALYAFIKYVFFTSFFEIKFIGSITGWKILIFIFFLLILMFFVGYIILDLFDNLKKRKKKKK